MELPLLEPDGAGGWSGGGGGGASPAAGSGGPGSKRRVSARVLVMTAVAALAVGVTAGALVAWVAMDGDEGNTSGGGDAPGAAYGEDDRLVPPEGNDDGNATVEELLATVDAEGLGSPCAVPAVPPGRAADDDDDDDDGTGAFGGGCTSYEAGSAALRMPTRAVDLVRSFEGFRPEFYTDPVGIRTIGYGHACHALRCSGPPFDKGHLTLAEAEQLLRDDLRAYEVCVRRLVGGVGARLTLNRYGALVSFAFNVGCGNLESSTLLRRLGQGRHADVGAELRRWVRGGGRVLPGLVRRREAEAALYDDEANCGGSWPAAAGDNTTAGVCRLAAACKGEAVPGYCPGPAQVTCCVREPGASDTCTADGDGAAGVCAPPDACEGRVAEAATGCAAGGAARCCVPLHVKPPLPDGACVADGGDGAVGQCSARCGAGERDAGDSASGCEDDAAAPRCCVPEEPPACQVGPGGRSGLCLATGECARQPQNESVAGFCAGPRDVQCCVERPPAGFTVSCTAEGLQGECGDTARCDGRSVPGHCPGASNIQCCVDAGRGSCRAGGVAGTCTDVANCAGVRTAGLCPGPASVQCCTDADAAAGAACEWPAGTETRLFDAYSRGSYLGRITAVRMQGKWVERNTGCAFRRMLAANPRLKLNSGFRTMAEQRRLYDCYQAGDCALAARPGFSKHQTGTALDISSSEYAWMAAHAHSHGFVRTVRSERWHWVYSPGSPRAPYT